MKESKFPHIFNSQIQSKQFSTQSDNNEVSNIARRFFSLPEHFSFPLPSNGQHQDPRPSMGNTLRYSQQERPIQLAKRTGPRRLAGERRDGLLRNVVDKVVPVKSTSNDDHAPSAGTDPASSNTNDNSVTSSNNDNSTLKPEGNQESPTTTITTTTTTITTTTTTTTAAAATAKSSRIQNSKLISRPSSSSDINNTGTTAKTSSTDDESNASSPKIKDIVPSPTKTSNSQSESQLPGIATVKDTNNKMSVTGGIVIAAVVVVGVISIWIFRKWKLSPSRQFKSKISGGSGCAVTGAYGAGYRRHDDGSDYNSYDNIFRRGSATTISLPPHPQMKSVVASSVVASSVIAKMAPAAVYQPFHAFGHDQEYLQQRYNDQEYNSQEYNSQDYYNPNHFYMHQEHQLEYQEYPNSQEYPQYSQRHSHHIEGSTRSMVNFGHYRNSKGAFGLEESSVKPSNSRRVPNAGLSMNSYVSEEYELNDQFLRELRE
ncbi:hypothetical protein BGZ46_009443 [Entomortierella lignicola]|nr:hypothetical protein BGZ46_009443 [Entomortierella lignicola]